MDKVMKSSNRAWGILAACCAFYAGSMALTSSILGVYMLPVSESIGISRGEFTLYMSVQSAACLVFLPIIGNLFAKTKNFKLLMISGSITLAAGIACFSFCNSLLMFCIFSLPIGWGMTVLYSVGGPTLIQNWFAPQYRGKMLGIAAAFSGVGTFVWAPLFTAILQNVGWQATYGVNAILALVLTLPFCAFVVKRSPEECGLVPYGATNATDEVAKSEAGMSAKDALKTVAIYIVELCCLACCLGMGFNSSLPAMCIEKFVPLGIMDASGAAMIGATLISVAAVGNIIGKIVYGALVDKFGSRVSLIFFAALTLAAFLIWLFTASVPFYYVAAFLFGTHNALMSVAFPLLIRQIYGNRDFPKIWSWVSMPFTFVGSSATAIVGFLYAGFGSYQATFVIGAIGIAVVGLLAIVATAFIGKYKWTLADGEVIDQKAS